MRSLFRLWHTTRHLRPVQIWGRLWFRVYRPKPDLRPGPAGRRLAAVWRACARQASMTGPLRFHFLEREQELRAAQDWNRADWPLLWLYNLHYFNDLCASDAVARLAWHQQLLRRWVADNPPGRGVGWDPYPTSLRIVNWVKWAWAGNDLTSELRDSLAVQARWLRGRLEVHLLGNHLWANAKALVFAGAYFEGPEADSWRSAGLNLLRRERVEQILPDGGHFERSPMYQAIVLEDLLDLLQLAQVAPGIIPEPDIAVWRQTVIRMHRWLRVMSHPDGDVALFNDTALDIAPKAGALAAYANLLGAALDQTPLDDVEPLVNSGYVRLCSGRAVLIADVGELGPSYLPGHAHADTLSFELSVGDGRVLANGGTSTYDVGPERLRQRGTGAHNTVVVDGADSSEVWSSFRVARRARPIDVRWGRDPDGVAWLEGAHTGYRRLPGRVLHRRRWRLEDGALTVQDELDGRWERAEAVFRFVPEWKVDGMEQVASRPSISVSWRATGGTPRVEAATWHPRFGATEECRALRIPFTSSVITTRFAWN